MTKSGSRRAHPGLPLLGDGSLGVYHVMQVVRHQLIMLPSPAASAAWLSDDLRCNF